MGGGSLEAGVGRGIIEEESYVCLSSYSCERRKSGCREQRSRLHICVNVHKYEMHKVMTNGPIRYSKKKYACAS